VTGVAERATAEPSPLAVVILAAGRGSRLEASVGDLPKWLAPVGARSIADWQLEGLRRAAGRWSRLLVVTGYRTELFDAASLSTVLDRPGELLHNPEYASRNNWYTLRLALSHLAEDGWDGSVGVLNSDLLVPPRMLERFLEAASGERRSLLAVDREAPRTDEQMKVALDPESGLVVDIGKGRLSAPPAGEYVGLANIDARDVGHLARILDSFLADPARTNEWYEAAFREAMRTGVEFGVFPVDPGRWIEVDDPGDLDRARELALLFEEED
jgi:choline kinase